MGERAETAVTSPLVGRSDQLAALVDFYRGPRNRQAGFLLLYGRRGVGKTGLLQQFLQDCAPTDVFYWTAPPGGAAMQLQDFSQALLRYDPHTPAPPPADFSFYDWQEALERLAQIAERSTDVKLFILEEFTELCHSAMGLSSYFQHAWDGRLKEITNLRLILTGSHISTMLLEVLTYSAPLYFRANASLYLTPLPFVTLLDLFPDRAVEERLLIYAITGGIPAYLSHFIGASDIASGVEKLCFSPNSPFLKDMVTLFDEHFDEPALYQKIVTAVANGHNNLDQLSGQLSVDRQALSHPLYFLGLIKLITEQLPVHQRINRTLVRYEVVEPSLAFYYQHLKPILDVHDEREPLSPLLKRQLVAAALTSAQRALGRKPWRALCREWLWAALTMRQLGMEPYQIGAYWSGERQTAEFAIAAADPDHKSLLVSAAYWESGQLTVPALRQFIRDSQNLPQAQNKKWCMKRIVFSRFPFGPAVQAIAAAHEVGLVLLAEIEPLLLAARERQRWQRDNAQSTGDIPF